MRRVVKFLKALADPGYILCVLLSARDNRTRERPRGRG